MIFNPSIGALAERVVRTFSDRNHVLATAESCTGGLIAGAITDISGSSAVLDRGFVTYSNDAKMDMLSVPKSLIIDYGAVSEPVARSMVLGALQYSNASIAVAVTGVAGPGASERKPAGMVYIACGIKNSETVTVNLHHFEGDRTRVREATLEQALLMLLGHSEALFRAS